MNKKTLTSIFAGTTVVVCLVLLIGGNSAVALEGGSTLSDVQKWEYRVLRIQERRGGSAAEVRAREKTSEAALNELGNLGWELVAVRTEQDEYPIFYFKRPLL
jgi:hypothetical protein